MIKNPPTITVTVRREVDGKIVQSIKEVKYTLWEANGDLAKGWLSVEAIETALSDVFRG